MLGVKKYVPYVTPMYSTAKNRKMREKLLFFDFFPQKGSGHRKILGLDATFH